MIRKTRLRNYGAVGTSLGVVVLGQLRIGKNSVVPHWLESDADVEGSGGEGGLQCKV